MIQLRKQHGRWLLWLDDGNTLTADDVVLAIGNPPPATLPEFREHAAALARSLTHRNLIETARQIS